MTLDRKNENTIHRQLLDLLRQMVAESSPGRKLPSENALANKYKIARMTVSGALNQLEAEGLISRQRGAGSFVAARPVFTFFLPCENFFSRTDSSTFSVRLQMQGAIRAAREQRISFETVAVSPRNHPEYIDYSCLDHINSSSMLLITPWFYRLFEPLVARQAKVCLLHAQDIPYGYRQYIRNWIKLERDRKSMVNHIIEIFHRQGFKRIALIAKFVLSEKNHPVHLAYLENISTSGQEPIIYEIENIDQDFPTSAIANLYHRTKFDAVIFGVGMCRFQQSVQELLGIPGDIPVFALDTPNELMQFTRAIPFTYPPYEQIGYDAVTLLADDRNRGVTRQYESEFFYKNITS